MEKINEIEKKLGVKFKNHLLLETAFTHRSFLNENRGKGLENNERLEFLGDAVLELIVSSNIYHNYPDKAEGELTSIRAAIVRTESLAEETERLNLGVHLRMSKGEKDSGGEEKPYLLANLYEAILGAIYLDSGYEECLHFVERTLLKKIKRIVNEKLFIDPKTKVQEIMQRKYRITPTYEILKEEGPDHSKSFTVALFMGDKKVVEGEGASKQKAEEDAAINAIDILEED
ncbi:MAG TPA: ribonuclease III [Candidatus Dojkabacteria bacterium]|jgi:ribonuclease-3|nr:ribonuclease III [Candidatus Dojkabacteria bacterium]